MPLRNTKKQTITPRMHPEKATKRMKTYRFTHWSRQHWTQSGLTKLTFATLILFGALLATACGETSRQYWPQLTVLASDSLQPVLISESGEFEKMNGTRLNIQYLDNEKITRRLHEGDGADVVILDDWPAMKTLAGDGVVLNDPWLFHLQREGLTVIALEASTLAIDKPGDLLDEKQGKIGTVNNGDGYMRRLTRETLHDSGILKDVEDRLWEFGDRAALVRALHAGKITVGLVSEKDYTVNEGGWRDGLNALLTIHPVDKRPADYAGGIAKDSGDVKTARRYWNFIEKAIRVHQPGIRSQTQERM